MSNPSNPCTLLSLFLLSVLVAVMASCGQTPAPATPAPLTATPPPEPSYVRVSGIVPLSGDALKNEVTVFFDKPIMVAQQPNGEPVLPLAFSPRLDGQFRIGSRFISFKPNPLPQGIKAVFSATIASCVSGQNGEPVDPQDATFSVPTFKFGLENASIEEARDEKTVAVLGFPSMMNGEELKQHMSILGPDKQPVAFELQQGTNGGSFRVVVQSRVPKDAMIVLSEGLANASGKLRLATTEWYEFPHEEPVAVRSVQWTKFAQDAKEFTLAFDRPVAPASVKEKLLVADAETKAPVAFEIPATKDSKEIVISLTGSTPDTVRLDLALAPGVCGSEQGRLEQAWSHVLEPYKREPVAKEFAETPGMLPALAVNDTHWQDRWEREDGREGAVLHVEFTAGFDSTNLKEHVQISPEVDALRIEPAGSGFLAYGNWESNKQYTIRVTAGLKDSEGHATEKDCIRKIVAEKVVPYVGFARPKEYYFPKRTGSTLPIETRDFDKVHVSLSRMFPSNLVVALDDIRGGKGSSAMEHRWGEEIGKTDLDVAAVRDRLTETPLQLDSLFPADRRGVFCISAEGTSSATAEENEWSSDTYRNPGITHNTKIVVWTNMGLLAHWRDDDLVIFVHDLFSLAALEKAKVSVYSQKNQLLATIETGSNGIARVSGWKPSLGSPAVVVAELGEDFTFLELSPRNEDAVQTPGGRPAGAAAAMEEMPVYDAKAYDAFMYADRDLYRPGETVHAHWQVRMNYGDAVASVPLRAKVLQPDGREMLSQPTTLDALGGGGYDIVTQRTYPTGKYTVQLAVPGGKGVIGSYTFNIENFVPNRMKATVTTDDTPWLPQKEYGVHLNAQHLFGAPAAGRKAAMDVIFKRDAVKLAGWETFRFGNDADFIPNPVSCGEQTTDDNGNASFTFRYDMPKAITCPLKAIVVGRVFELGGRAVGARADKVFFPSDIALGVCVAQPADGKGVEVLAAAVTPDGKPATLDKVKITLEKQVWNYYVRRYYSRHEPNWAEMFEPIETREVALANGQGRAVFTVNEWGYYRVRVHSESTPQCSTLAFYGYDGGFQNVDMARPSLLKVALDKETYVPGEEAEIRIESPFDGKGIVVVQTESIQDMLPIEIKDKVGTLKFPVTQKLFPNAWIEVTVIHAVQGDRKQMYPFSSFATACLNVRDSAHLLKVTYPDLPEEIKPATEAQFDVQVTDAAGGPVEAELTLAAVDEGIHGITDYKNPDPYGWLCRTRRADMRRAHYYDNVAYDLANTGVGGDLLLKDLQKRLPSADENWVKPVALWSDVVHTDGTGHAIVTMNVPEFTGQLRLVAVAGTASALGSGDANVFVRRPYMLRTSQPRFLLPGDTFKARAVVHNNTEAACKAHVSWASNGAITPTTGAKDLDVAAHGEANLEAEFAASTAVGQGALHWETVVTGTNGEELLRLQEDDPIPVRTPATYQTRHDLFVLKPGEQRELRNAFFTENSLTELKLTVGASPLLRLQEALGYTVHYPYGCVEQTTSSLLPLYVLRKNAAMIESVGLDLSELDNYIYSGIERLFTMMTASGGLAMWPGGREAYPYGSVYALNFLTLVKAGRDIDLPPEGCKALQEYVRQIAGGYGEKSESELFLRAYAVYVLAMDGVEDAVHEIQRFDSVTLPRSARYLLAAALAKNTQDKDRVAAYLAKPVSSAVDSCSYFGVLNSPIQNEAIELIALLEMDGDPLEIRQKAEDLVKFLGENHYGNTHETAFLLTALATYLNKLSGDMQNAAAVVEGEGEPEKIDGIKVYHGKRTGPGSAFKVENTGGVPVYLNLDTSGVPENNDVPASSAGGLSIERCLRTNLGDVMGGGTLEQGKSCVVDLTLECKEEAHNVIVADLLPAGFEIENPRLDPNTLPGDAFKDGVVTNSQKAGPQAEDPDREANASKQATASYLEVRDDRALVAFDTLPPGTHHIYYVVRAVTPGAYQYPPAQIESMYDASRHANTVLSRIEVK